MPLNYEEYRVTYKEQTQEGGLRSDGELVQGIGNTSTSHGAGSGKANMNGLSMVKYADGDADEFRFHTDLPPEDDTGGSTPVPILHCPSDTPSNDGTEKHFFTITLEDATLGQDGATDPGDICFV